MRPWWWMDGSGVVFLSCWRSQRSLSFWVFCNYIFVRLCCSQSWLFMSELPMIISSSVFSTHSNNIHVPVLSLSLFTLTKHKPFIIFILSSSSSGYNEAVMIFRATDSDIVREEKSLCTGVATVSVGPFTDICNRSHALCSSSLLSYLIKHLIWALYSSTPLLFIFSPCSSLIFLSRKEVNITCFQHFQSSVIK